MELKLVNLPPLIIDHFLEREHSWGDEPFEGFPLSFHCDCVNPFKYSLEQYKLIVYNLNTQPCCNFQRRLPPLPFTGIFGSEVY
jgi:hypothetical protein